MTKFLEKSALEKVGDAFTPQHMFAVRDMTRAAIHEIAAAVKPGMVEEDAVEMAKGILRGKKMLRGWHGIYVRFGTNTIKTFGEASDPGVVLGESDIFLIDIGPVFEQSEGDGGETFVVGNDADLVRCSKDAPKLFHVVRQKWLQERVSGKLLYQFAVDEAMKLGWALNMDLSGHRLSDFPHAAVYDGSMADVEFCPSPLLWVLEIHIRHPEKPFGAFYEDMLLDDNYFPDFD
jgi:hypothetical protein